MSHASGLPPYKRTNPVISTRFDLWGDSARLISCCNADYANRDVPRPFPQEFWLWFQAKQDQGSVAQGGQASGASFARELIPSA
jgi:hypothetical protein